MKKCSGDFCEKDLCSLFNMFDSNKKGKVNLGEFKQMLMPKIDLR